MGGALCGLVPRSALQCCNRSRYPAGRQPQPLPGGARSDPVGVLLDHGQVPGRNGRQRPSPGGRRARRPGSQERAAVLQPLEVPRWPAAPASPWWCEIRSGGRAAGPWPSARAGRQTGPSPGGRPAPAAWPPRTGDRGQEHVAVLQPLEAPRWPAAPASPWWCEIRSGGRAAGPWPSARAGRQTGPSPGGRPGPAVWPQEG